MNDIQEIITQNFYLSEDITKACNSNYKKISFVKQYYPFKVKFIVHIKEFREKTYIV